MKEIAAVVGIALSRVSQIRVAAIASCAKPWRIRNRTRQMATSLRNQAERA